MGATVYALDVRRRRRIRIDGVVHYVRTEGLRSQDSPPVPWSTRCGIQALDDGLTYLGDGEDIAITCIACVADRRH